MCACGGEPSHSRVCAVNVWGRRTEEDDAPQVLGQVHVAAIGAKGMRVREEGGHPYSGERPSHEDDPSLVLGALGLGDAAVLHEAHEKVVYLARPLAHE